MRVPKGYEWPVVVDRRAIRPMPDDSLLSWFAKSDASAVASSRAQSPVTRIGGAGAGSPAKEVGGLQFAARALDGVPPKDLKPMADELKKQIGSGVVALVSAADGKASIVVGVTDDLTDQVSAVDLVRVGSEKLGGKGGGGRPDMAQAGGPDGSAGEAALAAIEEAIAAGVAVAAE